MLIYKTALKNMIKNGRKSLLNIIIISFTFVIITGFNGIVDGWIKQARNETIKWEIGGGQIWHTYYDKYDVFRLNDAHDSIPETFQSYIINQTLSPILATQATLYNKGKDVNVLLKGIESTQNILKLPTEKLESTNCIIGKRMARSAKLSIGDNVIIRWRDKNGTFDAIDIHIADIFDSDVPAIDANHVWMDFSVLQNLTGLHNEASYFVIGNKKTELNTTNNWHYYSPEDLMADIIAFDKSQRMEAGVIFIILLAVALLAIFETQVLSLFYRKKEIATYIALGLSQRQVVKMFTIEGTLYSIMGILLALIWGTPVLYWFSLNGLKLTDLFENSNVPGGGIVYPAYELTTILTCIIIIIVSSFIISYIPSRKIAKENIAYVLKTR